MIDLFLDYITGHHFSTSDVRLYSVE